MNVTTDIRKQILDNHVVVIQLLLNSNLGQWYCQYYVTLSDDRTSSFLNSSQVLTVFSAYHGIVSSFLIWLPKPNVSLRL
jgi:hypothetical protein